MAQGPMNREAWLNRLAEMLRPWFRKSGLIIHGRMSVSMAKLPSTFAGLCTMQRHKDDINHIFISVYEDGMMSDQTEVGCVLVHEILHAVLPAGSGHGPLFKAAMPKLDLIGKATATLGGPDLRKHIDGLIEHLGPLPRHGITAPPPKGPGGGQMGMMRFQCPNCRISVFLKYRTYQRAGTPICWNEKCAGRTFMVEVTEVKDC